MVPMTIFSISLFVSRKREEVLSVVVREIEVCTSLSLFSDFMLAVCDTNREIEDVLREGATLKCALVLFSLSLELVRDTERYRERGLLGTGLVLSPFSFLSIFVVLFPLGHQSF